MAPDGGAYRVAAGELAADPVADADVGRDRLVDAFFDYVIAVNLESAQHLPPAAGPTHGDAVHPRPVAQPEQEARVALRQVADGALDLPEMHPAPRVQSDPGPEGVAVAVPPPQAQPEPVVR